MDKNLYIRQLEEQNEQLLKKLAESEAKNSRFDNLLIKSDRFKKYYSDDKQNYFGIILSNEYGAGWSTQESLKYDERISRLFNYDLIYAWQHSDVIVFENLIQAWGYKVSYNSFMVHFVSIDRPFQIESDDGLERVCFLDIMRFYVG